jgi:aldehyde:ferredoxin oxidoreductase
MPPYHDPFMFDYNWQGIDGKNMAAALATGIYSESKAKQVAWQRHWSRFWKQSVLYCDMFSPVFVGGAPPDYEGFSPDWEVKFFNAVTGLNFAFADGMELGRKIFNLDRAIWVLQGRHRDQEVFNPWMYKPGTNTAGTASGLSQDGSKWAPGSQDMFLDKQGFEEWKTKFYKLEGWDSENGWPTGNTLDGLGLGHVADELASKGKLGGSRFPSAG